MPKLTICRGVSGSGKSTWARNQGATVVSRDSIRDMLYVIHRQDPHEYYKLSKDILSACENRVTVVQDSMIAAMLRTGNDVIVDNTNVQFTFVKAIAKIGYRYGADVEVKVFDVPLDGAIRRDSYRGLGGGRLVGPDVITKQYNSLKANKSMKLDPVSYPKPYTGTPGKPVAIMCDIDGTLADMGDKRGPYDLNVEVDTVRSKVAELVDTLWCTDIYTVIIMSGRKEDCRGATDKWLWNNGIGHDHLFMRKSDDNRSDNLIKADLFDEFVRDNYDVQFVIDDRPQVCDMWRRLGLEVFQVADPYKEF